SQQRFGGHGSALAQVYNHVIMPLANRRDKQTQIRWGLYDFAHRFGRPPAGMWLAETAVDLETLDLLAENGIGFTILSPFQAKQFRKTGDEAWQDVTGGKIDPTLAYALSTLEEKHLAKLTNYGEFLQKNPPAHEVEVLENTSWSCSHGIERWRSHCGCNSGRDGWSQLWRTPLREALDWLRDTLAV